MRCHYCDHSDDGAGSIYEDSLSREKRPGRVRFRPSIGEDICERCWEESFELPCEAYPEDVIPLLLSEWDEPETPEVLLPDDDFN